MSFNVKDFSLSALFTGAATFVATAVLATPALLTYGLLTQAAGVSTGLAILGAGTVGIFTLGGTLGASLILGAGVAGASAILADALDIEPSLGGIGLGFIAGLVGTFNAAGAVLGDDEADISAPPPTSIQQSIDVSHYESQKPQYFMAA